MISLQKFKELLGEEARGLNDQEIELIRDAQYQMAIQAFRQFAKNKGFNKRVAIKSQK